MNRTESLRNWIVILALLVVTGVITAVWSLISSAFNISLDIGFGSGSARPPVESSVTVVVPAPLVGLQIPFGEPLGAQIVMTQTQIFLAFLAFLAVVVVSVVVTGLIISFLIRALDKSATAVATSDSYQKSVTALEKQEKERIQQLRAQSPKPNQPEGYVYQLDPISLSWMVLFFIGTVATLIYSLVVSSGEITLLGLTLDSRISVLLFFMLVTVPILALVVRRRRLDAVRETDNASIPWDFIAILTTGLLIVGIGLGVMLFIMPGG